MKLSKLLSNISYKTIYKTIDFADIEINNIVYDSRKVSIGDLFICMKGAKSNGHDYINDVCKKGAAVIVIQDDVSVCESTTLIKVEDTRLVLAQLSAAYFSHPANALTTIGITGTKGKTTTAYMIRSILEYAGIKTGLIGTVEVIIGDTVLQADNTTPESYLIQDYLSQMVQSGCKCVVMEVSSQGLMLKRAAGFKFDYGIFTNLEPDHIAPNEHKDFDDYLYWKASLFKQCKIGIFNIDDSHVRQIMDGNSCSIVKTFGMSKDADIRAENIKLINKDGVMGVEYDVSGEYDFHNIVNIPGRFSVYNSLTAIAVCRHFNIPIEIMQDAFLNVKVKGRVETVDISDSFTLMIDYAHNAMSLESLLSTLKEYHPKRLVCMFGCGGDRAKDRRFEMGKISSQYADLTVITSDNPRTEKPEDIIVDILVGVKKADGAYIAIEDRKSAIRYCISNAIEGDVIVLAGKGHEDYQEINGVKYHMDDREMISEIVNDLLVEGHSKVT